jgi:ATP-dependent RNA helicase DeaD
MPTTTDTGPFAALGIPDTLSKTLATLGYETPSPIQAQSIPLLLKGGDLIGQAQTGTGKTAAFALPILSTMKAGSKSPQALVICPTRELAIQVAEAFQTYARGMKNFHVLPVYGGQEMSTQLRQLRRGVDVVVGTPGRLLDHLKRRTLDLSTIKTVVLDEADEMLRMGFIDDVEEILSHTGGTQQTVLFSATLPEPIRRVAARFLKNPSHVKIESKAATVDTIAQHYWLVSNNNQKLDALTQLLEAEEFDGVIIFTRTRGTTVELAEKISARGYACSAINGDMSQSAREQTISRLKKGKIDILVATDVAARGLDVERVSLVVNYDIPHDPESYIHRIGRTGRAGREGRAVLFVTSREQRLLRSIEKTTNRKIPLLKLPTAEEIIDQRRERFKASILESLATRPAPIFAQLVTELCEASGETPTAVAAAMAEMLQKDRPLDSPPVVASSPRAPAPREAREARAPRAPRENDRDRGERKTRSAADDENVQMQTYRIEVGHDHEVSPGNIVGAIANEIDIDSKYIGGIRIYDDHSTVELPTGMPAEIFQHLKRVRVRSRPLNITLADGKPEGAPAAKKPHKKKLAAAAKAAGKPAGKSGPAKGKKPAPRS